MQMSTEPSWPHHWAGNRKIFTQLRLTADPPPSNPLPAEATEPPITPKTTALGQLAIPIWSILSFREVAVRPLPYYPQHSPDLLSVLAVSAASTLVL